MIIWLAVAGLTLYLTVPPVVRFWLRGKLTARERLERMLASGQKYRRRTRDEAIDAYRDEVLALSEEVEDEDWEIHFWNLSAAVRELFDGAVEVSSHDDPVDELEALQAGLKLYPDARAWVLAGQLRTWIRKLHAAKKIGDFGYEERMAAADFTDPDMEDKEE